MDSDNLMQALYAMDWERIKAKLNTGADVNAPYNKHGWTPFMWACREFYELEAIETFLAAGGDVNSRNQYEDCLLYTSPSPRDPKTSRMPSSA